MDHFGCKGIHDTTIPQANTTAEAEALYPLGYFNLQISHRVAAAMGDHIIWWPGDFQVLAIGFSWDFARLENIAGRMFQLVRGFMGDVEGGGYINSVGLPTPIRTGRQAGDVQMLYIGALWRIKARLSNT
jgi:hypothetical protein